jgi:hypothetical protein
MAPCRVANLLFNSSGIRYRELKTFLVQNAERVKRHAMIIAEQEGRPYMYLHEKVRKEELAKQIAERDHIEQGLVCILSVWSLAVRSRSAVKTANRLSPQVSVPIFLFYPSRFRVDARPATNMVSAADPDLCQRT